MILDSILVAFVIAWVIFPLVLVPVGGLYAWNFEDEEILGTFFRLDTTCGRIYARIRYIFFHFFGEKKKIIKG